MALERPETGYVWLHVPLREAVDVVVCGEVHSWWSHWTGTPGLRLKQAVRCVAHEMGECAWCAAGSKRQCRYVFPVRIDGDLKLVELGRVQYPILALCEQEGGLVGRRLRLVREWAAKNAPIVVRPVAREHVSPEHLVDLREFVGQMGLGQLKLIPVPQSTPPSKTASSGGEAARVARQGVSGEAAPSPIRMAYEQTRKRE